ncbi:reverse transcriptase [Tanacetum coccineum]
MKAFLEACNYCNLNDMSARGVKFNWSNGRRGAANVKKRLDRFQTNKDWLNFFPGASFHNLTRVASDHSPIVSRLLPHVKKKTMFRFENMWSHDESIHEVVKDAWANGVAAEVLSSMIRKSVTQGYIHGVKVCRGAPTISHLFFANDSIFFSRASKVESCRLKSILDQYCKASGQSILDRIKRKLGGWKEKTISIAGKKVLIKSVAQAMPIVAFDHISTTLAGKVLKACYFSRSSFLDAKGGYHPSYIWRSFIAVKELVRKGYKWNISNGRSVNVWEDFWLVDHKRLGSKPYNSEVNYVRDLLNNEGNDQNYEQLTSLFPSNIANKIACSFVCQSTPNSLYWYNNPQGEFSCNSAYLLALEMSKELGTVMMEDFCSIILDHSPTHWDDFMMILLGLWTRQNKHFHGQAKRREVDVEVMANQLLLDYLNENKKEIARREGTP